VKVLEYNARFGDPETQAYMRLLGNDLLDLIEACLDGTIGDQKLQWAYGYVANIVLASQGYPDESRGGLPILGIADAEQNKDVVVFQAGTTSDGVVTKTVGGRILSVTALGSPLQQALDAAYRAVGRIHFEGMQYRHDIGAASLK
jgi:phosphoribosylamine--glycine ligase